MSSPREPLPTPTSTASASESDDEDQFHESNSDEWLLGKVYYQDKKRICSHQSARTFAPNIENFTYNRRLNQEHVKYLAKQISQAGQVLDTISMAFDGTKLRVLNGQHRIQALLICLQEAPEKDFQLHLTTYLVPRINSQETLELFKSLNHTLNLEDNPVLDDIHQIIETLKRKYPKAILDTDKRCQRPNVDARRLKERLEVNLLNHFQSRLDVEKMTNCIIQKNATYSVTPLKTIFGNNQANSRKRHEKASKTGWYLTMKDMDPLPNDAHKDELGNKLFCDRWMTEVIKDYQD